MSPKGSLFILRLQQGKSLVQPACSIEDLPEREKKIKKLKSPVCRLFKHLADGHVVMDASDGFAQQAGNAKLGNFAQPFSLRV